MNSLLETYIIMCVLLSVMFKVNETKLCLSNPRCYCSTQKDIKIICKNVTELSAIEELLEGYPHIYSLTILSNTLARLPSKSFAGKSIIALDISSPLRHIEDDSLSEIVDLQIVNFNDGQFPEVPPAVANSMFKIVQLVNGVLTRIGSELQNNSGMTDIVMSRNRIVDIDQDAFRNAVSLQTLNMSRNRIAYLVQEVFEDLKQLRSIDLSFNLISNLDGCFKNLNPQEIILYGNNLSNIDKALHRSMWRMKTLDLGGNPHLYITPSTFEGTMPSLSILSLNKIGFEDFNPFILKNFRNLHRLQLNGNRLSVLPSDFLIASRTPYLSILELSNNNLVSTEVLFPLGNCQPVRKNREGNDEFDSMQLDDNVTEFSNPYDRSVSFSNYGKDINQDGDQLKSSQGNSGTKEYSLQSSIHNMKSNRIVSNQSQSDHYRLTSRNIIRTRLGGIKIKLIKMDQRTPDTQLDTQKSPVHTLKTVKLDGNKINSLSFGSTARSVLHLDLGSNEIQKLDSNHLKNLTSVTTFNLSGNPLNEITADCFNNQLRLRTLDLSSTDLRHLNLSVRNLADLEHLWVDSSSLVSLEEDELRGLNSLELLSLRNNTLTSVYGAMRNLSYLTNVDVSFNNLTTLTSDSLPLNAEGLVTLKKLWMEGNPWSCDCRLTWLLDWLTQKGSQLEDDPTCHSPPRLHGTSLRDLNVTVLQYWQGEDCPSDCDCHCVAEGGGFLANVNCSGRHLVGIPETFPETSLEIDLSENDIVSMEGFGSLSLLKLQVLNLEDNHLVAVSLLPRQPLVALRLAGNNISRFLLQEWNVTSMTLSRNPWTCDCEAWQFRQWLVAHDHIVEDLNEVRCGSEGIFKDRAVMDLTFEDVCLNSNASSTIIIAVAVVSFVATCIGAFIFRKTLVVLFYAIGFQSLRAKEKHLHPFDAFLLYADEDEDYALGTIAEGLEAEGFKLFIPTRNVFLASSSSESIESSLMDCSKVIVLLTKHFLENGQCMQLLKASISCSIENTARRLIFVTSISEACLRKSDAVLAAVLRNSNRILRGECLFWTRLKYLMPRERKTSEIEEGQPFLQEGSGH